MQDTQLIIILVLIGLLVAKEVVLWVFKRVAPKWISGNDRFDNIDQQLDTIGTNHLSHIQDSLNKIEKNTSEMCRKMELHQNDIKDVQQRVINMQTDGVRRKNGSTQ